MTGDEESTPKAAEEEESIPQPTPGPERPYRPNKFRSFLAAHVGKECLVKGTDGETVRGKIKLWGLDHCNVVVDTGREHVFFRMFEWMRIPRTNPVPTREDLEIEALKNTLESIRDIAVAAMEKGTPVAVEDVLRRLGWTDKDIERKREAIQEAIEKAAA